MPSNAGGNSNGIVSHSKGESNNGLSTPVKVVANENPLLSSETTGSADPSTSSDVTCGDYGLLPSADANICGDYGSD